MAPATRLSNAGHCAPRKAIKGKDSPQQKPKIREEIEAVSGAPTQTSIHGIVPRTMCSLRHHPKGASIHFLAVEFGEDGKEVFTLQLPPILFP